MDNSRRIKNQSAWNIINLFAVLISRTALLVISYFITAWLFIAANLPDAYESARIWWPLSLIFINAIVLTWLFLSVKREGASVVSLIGFNKKKLRNDVLNIIWTIPVSIILAVGGTFIFGLVIYQNNIPSDLTSISIMPAWAIIVSLTIHPLVNAFVEEMTYNGYVFPRLRRILNSSWLTVIIITFFFTLQHIAIPLVLDIKFIMWRFLSFFPLILFWVLINAKMRRLTTLVIIHWIMDVFGLLTVMFIPSS